MPDWFWYAVVFGYGAIVGSFLNVLIYRMPLGMSVSTPPSHCPRCKTRLGFWDNIPLLSFLFLRARCRYCLRPISWRYFTVELMTACLWVALFWRLSGETGVSWVNYVAHALFASVLVAVIFIDLDHFIIPDELNWVGTALGIGRDLVCLLLAWQAGPWFFRDAAPAFAWRGWLPWSLVGAAVYASILFLISFVGFLYYARAEGESLGQVARRFFTLEDPPEPEQSPESAPETETEEEEEEEEGEPVRLRFSPAFLAAVASLLLVPVLHGGAVVVFAGTFAAFVALSRWEFEPVGSAAARFFRSNDQEGAPEPPWRTPFTTPDPDETEAVDAAPAPEDAAEAGDSETETPLSATEAAESVTEAAEPVTEAQLAAEADQFALEAESGKHGAMGLGDVKLALAIGAILGPGPALLSLLFATGLGAATGIGMALRHGKSLRLALPFGPFMAVGAVIVMLYGQQFVGWYLRFSGIADR